MASSAPRTPEHIQAKESVDQWKQSTGKVFRFNGMRRNVVPLNFGYSALDLADPALGKTVRKQKTDILSDQRLLSIVRNNIRDLLKPTAMANIVADPLTDIIEARVKFMIEDAVNNAKAMNFVLKLATPRETAAYLAGLLTESGSRILLSDECPSVDILRGLHRDQLDNSIGCYLVLNLRVQLAYIGSRTSWLPITVPGLGGINLRKCERENIDYLLSNIYSLFNFYAIDRHSSQDPSDWTAIDKNDMIWIPMMLTDRSNLTQQTVCRARAYSHVCEPILSLCLATHHEAVRNDLRRHSIWQKTWWTGGNNHYAATEAIHGLPYQFITTARKFKNQHIQDIDVLKNLSPDSAWLISTHSTKRLHELALENKVIPRSNRNMRYGELLAELITSGIQPPSVPDPIQMGEEKLMKLSRQELLDMTDQSQFPGRSGSYSRKNLVEHLLKGAKLLNKQGAEKQNTRPGTVLADWNVFSSVELRRQAVKHGISFFNNQGVEPRKHLIARFFLAGLGHLAGDEMIRRGMANRLGHWSLFWQLKARGLEVLAKDILGCRWQQELASKMADVMNLEPDYDTPEVYDGEPSCGWDAVKAEALICHPHMLGYTKNKFRRGAILPIIKSRQASDPSCYNQFPTEFLAALLEVTVELKYGLTRVQAHKKITSVRYSAKAAIIARLYVENGGIPGVPDTGDPDLSEQLTADELDDDSDYQDSGNVGAGTDNSDDGLGELSGDADDGNEDSDEEDGKQESDDQDSGIIYKNSGSKRVKVYGKRPHGSQDSGNQLSGSSLPVDDQQRGAARQTAKRKVPVLATFGRKGETAPEAKQATISFKDGRMYTKF